MILYPGSDDYKSNWTSSRLPVRNRAEPILATRYVFGIVDMTTID
jgi:hypothetical protein